MKICLSRLKCDCDVPHYKITQITSHPCAFVLVYGVHMHNIACSLTAMPPTTSRHSFWLNSITAKLTTAHPPMCLFASACPQGSHRLEMSSLCLQTAPANCPLWTQTQRTPFVSLLAQHMCIHSHELSLFVLANHACKPPPANECTGLHLHPHAASDEITCSNSPDHGFRCWQHSLTCVHLFAQTSCLHLCSKDLCVLTQPQNRGKQCLKGENCIQKNQGQSSGITLHSNERHDEGQGLE